MRAYELHPEDGFASLTMVDRPAPAATLGDHDVRVRVRAVSLNFRDLNIARAAKKRAKRVVPVSDGAGEVIAVGAQVTCVAPGDRVAAAFFPTWIDGGFREEHHAKALGGSIDGMLAEEVVLPAAAWVKLSPHLSFEQAATLPCAGVTAYNALFEAVTLRPGAVVLVQGTGGVSMLALQLARAAGATVIATSKTAAKAERARALGAAAVIDYAANPAWGKIAYDLAGGGVDLVIEVGGPQTFEQSVAATRIDGAIGLVGILTGERGEIDLSPIRRKSIHVLGITVGSARTLAALDRAIARWALQPVIDRVFAFDEAAHAFDHLASGAQFGKVVIRV